MAEDPAADEAPDPSHEDEVMAAVDAALAPALAHAGDSLGVVHYSELAQALRCVRQALAAMVYPLPPAPVAQEPEPGTPVEPAAEAEPTAEELAS